MVQRGRVVDIDTTNSKQLKATIKTPTGQYFLEVDHIIQCAGPQYAIQPQNQPFVDNLYLKQLIEWDALRFGLSITTTGSAKGLATQKIYPIGSLLFGTKFETTSVPDIRDEAGEIAKMLLNNLP